MPTIDTLFIIIVSVMIVSLILAIIDWIYLGSLSSKSSIIEREVEKRSQEFDALKKDRSAERSQVQGQATVIESNEPLANTPPSDDPREDTIQIVRNVRGNFESSGTYTNSSAGESGETPHIAAPPDTSIGTLEYSTVTPYSHNVYPDNSVPVEQNYQQDSPRSTRQRMIPAGVNDGSSPPPRRSNAGRQTTGPAVPHNPPQRLQLYSDATKDADFQLLWKNINDILQQQPDAPITVDLTGIHFMYGKEMEYLEKINYLLTSQGGTLSFINCDTELHEMINQRPQLRSLVR
jgi:hypothetical protein